MRFLIYLLLLRTKLASSELSARLCRKVTSLDQSVVADGVSQGFLLSEMQMLIFIFFLFLFPFQTPLNSQVFCACMGEEQLVNQGK